MNKEEYDKAVNVLGISASKKRRAVLSRTFSE